MKNKLAEFIKVMTITLNLRFILQPSITLTATKIRPSVSIMQKFLKFLARKKNGQNFSLSSLSRKAYGS